MTAKKSFIPVISLTTLLVVLLVLLGLFVGDGTNDFAVLSDSLPENTVAFAAISELGLLLEEASDPSSPLSSFQAGLFLDEVAEGHQPPDWWIDRGVALDEPFGIALLSLSPFVVVSSCGFNGDFDDLVELSEELTIFGDQSFSTDEIDGVPALVSDRAVFASNNGRLWSIVAINFLSDDLGRAELEEIAAPVLTEGFEQTLSQSDNFASLMAFEQPVQAIVYVNTRPIFSLFVDDDDPLQNLLGIAGGMSFGDDHVVWLSQARFDTAALDPAQYVGPGRHTDPLLRIPGPIWVGVHGSVNEGFLSEGIEIMSSYSHRLDRHVAHTREFLDEVVGVDLESDILTHLTGELGLFVGPSQSAGELDRLAAFAGVSSESSLSEALEEVGIRLMGGRGYPPTVAEVPLDDVDGTSVVRITLDSGTPAALFIESGYLWVTIGEGMAEQIIRAEAPSFLTQSDDIEEHFTSDFPAVAYVALPEVIQAGFVHDVEDLFPLGAWPFDDLFFTADVQGDLVVSETRSHLGSTVDVTNDTHPTPISRPGLSRANPAPLGTAVQLNGWQIEVLEVERRGDDIARPSTIPVEMEPLRVRIGAVCDGVFRRTYGLRDGQLWATGSSGVLFETGHPTELNVEVITRGEDADDTNRAEEHWLTYWIPPDETQLLLIFSKNGSDMSGGRRFLALEDGPYHWTAAGPSENNSELGIETDEPVPIGETTEVGGWEITVDEVLRGGPAQRLMREQGVWSLAPEIGSEFLQIHVTIRGLGTGDESASIDNWDFAIADMAGSQRISRSTFPLRPQLDASVFPGGMVEGWIAFEIETEETNAVLRYCANELTGWEEVCRYISLQPANTRVFQPVVGETRQQPVSRGSSLSTRGWELQVVQVLRGEEVKQRLRTEFPHRDPPPADAEIVAVLVRAEFIQGETEFIGLDLTGDNGRVYTDDSWWSFRPRYSPFLHIEDSPEEGWLAYVVQPGEDDLMLVVDGAQTRFLAVDDGASIATGDVSSTAPTLNDGDVIAMRTPFRIGDWEVAVTEVRRGAAALVNADSELLWEMERNPTGTPLVLELSARNVSDTDVPMEAPVGDWAVRGADDSAYLRVDHSEMPELLPGGSTQISAFVVLEGEPDQVFLVLSLGGGREARVELGE